MTEHRKMPRINNVKINTSSSALQEWSQHYNAIAQEQQRSTNTLPDRMPAKESVDDMMKYQERILVALQRMQSIISEQASIDQRLRDQSSRAGGDYEDEMSIYGDDLKNHGYTSEGKKRRGVCSFSSAKVLYTNTLIESCTSWTMS